MTRTEYSWMTSKELVAFALNSKAPLPLVVELAQRLDVYLNEAHAAKESTPCQPQRGVSKTP